MVVWQVDKIGRGQFIVQLTGDDDGVLPAQGKGDDRPDVADHGLSKRLIQLTEVLVGKHQVESILAGFAENRLKPLGGEVLKLIDVQIEVPAVLREPRKLHPWLATPD